MGVVSRQGGHSLGVWREWKGKESGLADPAGVTLMSGRQASTRVCPGDSMVCVAAEEAPGVQGAPEADLLARSQLCGLPRS